MKFCIIWVGIFLGKLNYRLYRIGCLAIHAKIHNSISTGSVSNIIKESRRKEIIDIDLLRTTALMMKKADLEINDLSSTVRLRSLLSNLDLPEEQVEKFLLDLSIYNYKNDIKDPLNFILEVKRVADYVSRLDVSVFDIIDYIENMKLELEDLKKEILGERMDLGMLKHQLSELKSSMGEAQDLNI
jgi:hypothetical protein